MLCIDWVAEYDLWWHGGSRFNNKAEAMALWSFLWFATQKNINSLNIYGDSKALIDEIMVITDFYLALLLGWIRSIKYILRLYIYLLMRGSDSLRSTVSSCICQPTLGTTASESK